MPIQTDYGPELETLEIDTYYEPVDAVAVNVEYDLEESDYDCVGYADYYCDENTGCWDVHYNYCEYYTLPS